MHKSSISFNNSFEIAQSLLSVVCFDTLVFAMLIGV